MGCASLPPQSQDDSLCEPAATTAVGRTATSRCARHESNGRAMGEHLEIKACQSKRERSGRHGQRDSRRIPPSSFHRTAASFLSQSFKAFSWLKCHCIMRDSIDWHLIFQGLFGRHHWHHSFPLLPGSADIDKLIYLMHLDILKLL